MWTQKKGRIVVAPIYHMVKLPVGLYYAIASRLGCWGVMAVEGRVELESKYEEG